MKNNTPKLRFREFTDEWQDKKLGDLLSPNLRETDKPKYPYLALGIRSHFKGTFQKPNSDPIKIDMVKLFVVKKGDLIVNITFAWEGAVAIAKNEDDGGLVSHRFPTYIFQEDQAVCNFFRYLYPTKRFVYELGLASPGGAGRNRVLNKKDFLNIKLVTPSIHEQQKIANFLTVVDEKINKLEEKKNGFEKYKKGVMQRIFSQKVRFKKHDGSDYPDWEEKKLGEIGRTYNGLTGKSAEDFGEGSPYITYMQIFQNALFGKNSKIGHVRIKNNEKQNKVARGDILFTTSSETPEEVGFSSAVLKDIDREVYLNSFSFGYRLNDIEKTLPIFLQFLFRSKFFRKNVIKLAQGSTRFNLSKNELMKVIIGLPNTEEQEKIAEFLTSLDNKVELINKKLEQAKIFKKGLLQKMFV